MPVVTPVSGFVVDILTELLLVPQTPSSNADSVCVVEGFFFQVPTEFMAFAILCVVAQRAVLVVFATTNPPLSV